MARWNKTFLFIWKLCSAFEPAFISELLLSLSLTFLNLLKGLVLDKSFGWLLFVSWIFIEVLEKVSFICFLIFSRFLIYIYLGLYNMNTNASFYLPTLPTRWIIKLKDNGISHWIINLTSGLIISMRMNL